VYLLAIDGLWNPQLPTRLSGGIRVCDGQLSTSVLSACTYFASPIIIRNIYLTKNHEFMTIKKIKENVSERHRKAEDARKNHGPQFLLQSGERSVKVSEVLIISKGDYNKITLCIAQFNMNHLLQNIHCTIHHYFFTNDFFTSSIVPDLTYHNHFRLHWNGFLVCCPIYEISKRKVADLVGPVKEQKSRTKTFVSEQKLIIDPHVPRVHNETQSSFTDRKTRGLKSIIH
jgi:hypothetical protein